MDKLELITVHGFKGVQATENIPGGTVLGVFDGIMKSQADQYTLQVSETHHVDTPSQLRYINHSCDPNMRFVWLEGDGEASDEAVTPVVVSVPQMVTMRDISAGEQLTFNYNTTEWHMDVPFECLCASAVCCKHVQGYKHLQTDQQSAIDPTVAPHIRRLAAQAK